MKEKIANWYRKGLWTKNMVYNAVIKNVITMDDYSEIIGEDE